MKGHFHQVPSCATSGGRVVYCANTGGGVHCAISVQELRPEVLEFALLMEARLRLKDADKGQSWKQKRIHDLAVALETKAHLVRCAVHLDNDQPAAIRHAVDLANYSMFIADVSGALTDTEDNGGDGWAGLDQVQMR